MTPFQSDVVVLLCVWLTVRLYGCSEAKRKEAEAESSLLAVGASRTSPEELIRNERIRVMEAEKKQLELLVKQLQMKKEEEQTRLNIKREMATNAIEDLRQVSNDMRDAAAFAKDYARGSAAN